MRTYTIGRGAESNVVTPPGNLQVSRTHARLHERPNGKFLLEDAGSSSGTFVLAGGAWRRVTSLEIGPSTPIRLGDFETTAESLLSAAATRVVAGVRAPAPAPLTRPPSALPAQGEAEIFVSYTRDDVERVRPLVRLLEQQGWRVFWDRNIETGQQWNDEIDRAMRSAKVVVVVWSRRSVHSKWVKAEAMTAHDRQIMLPVRIEDVAIPLPFGLVQTTDLWGTADSVRTESFRRFLAAAARMLQRPVRESNPELLQSFFSPEATFSRFDPMKAYLDMNGRMRRKHYWLALALMTPVQLVGNTVTNAVATNASMAGSKLSIMLIAAILNCLVFSYPLAALFSKRLHDINLSGYVAIVLIGLVWLQVVHSFSYLAAMNAGVRSDGAGFLAGLLVLMLPSIFIGLWPGSIGANRHGPSPR